MDTNDRTNQTESAGETSIKYSLSSLDEEPSGKGTPLSDLSIQPPSEDYIIHRNTVRVQYRTQDTIRDNERKKTAKKMFSVFAILIAIIIAYSTWQTANDNSSAPDGVDPLPKPQSGTIVYGTQYHTDSTITVTAPNNRDCVVSLKDSLGNVYLSFYVRAGRTATVSVPQKRIYVYFASGKEWYGYGEGRMFGKNTSYAKDKEPCDFSNGQSWSYTLHPVTDGNFSETPIDEDEFF